MYENPRRFCPLSVFFFLLKSVSVRKASQSTTLFGSGCGHGPAKLRPPKTPALVCKALQSTTLFGKDRPYSSSNFRPRPQSFTINNAVRRRVWVQPCKDSPSENSRPRPQSFAINKTVRKKQASLSNFISCKLSFSSSNPQNKQSCSAVGVGPAHCGIMGAALQQGGFPP